MKVNFVVGGSRNLRVEPLVLLDRIYTFILKHRLCLQGQKILVACSGGSDSTALLDILRRLAPKMGISIGVLHVDHRQHSSSSKAMAQVKTRCSRWRLPFYACSLEKKLPKGANEVQMRKVRYEVFEQIAHEHDYHLVATGHTQTDQVETVFMRIIRGTGPKGLEGIPVSRSRYIRPLLNCTREELIDYLKSRRLSWIQDPTNRNKRHIRNRIRNELLPQIRRLNPAVDRAIVRLSESAQRDNNLIEGLANAVTLQKTENNLISISLDDLKNLHNAVLTRVILKMLAAIGPSGVNLEQEHLALILSALREDKISFHWAFDLPGDIHANLKNDQFYMRYGSIPEQPGFCQTVSGPGEIILPDGQSRLIFSIKNKISPAQASNHRVFFDAEQVQFPLIVRSVTTGDRLRLWGGAGSRKVSRILLDAKIPRHLRSCVPVLVKDDTILWVAGLRRSDAAKIDRQTKKVLVVEFRSV